MPLRSVVVEGPPSPPTPRRTVVLRAGAPAPKGRWIDVIVGVLGALLLVSAVVLAAILPDKTYVNPQFRLTFQEADGEGPGTQESPLLTAGANVHEFPLEIDLDNVQSITLDIGFEDDIRYSLPDIFTVDLIAPNGTLMGHIEALQNPAPKAAPGTTDPPEVEGVFQIAPFSGWASHQESIVGGLTHTETAEQVHARLEPQYRVSTAGTWTVRVQLVNAQGCPDPQSESFRGQSGYCRFGHPGDPGFPNDNDGEAGPEGLDPGNAVKLFNYRYTFYTVFVEELK